MAQEITIRPGRLALILRNLEKPTKATKRIGALLVAAGQRAFREQKFDDLKWPVRYPNQSGPFVHIAGSVQDLTEGGTPKNQRFFVRGVALRDTGALFNSIKDESKAVTLKSDFEVTYGSNLPYAGLHNYGGISRQPITQDMRMRLAKWMRSLGSKSKSKRSKQATKERAGAVLSAAREKLGFLFGVSELKTAVNRRPFVGMYPKLALQITETVERTLTEGS